MKIQGWSSGPGEVEEGELVKLIRLTTQAIINFNTFSAFYSNMLSKRRTSEDNFELDAGK